MGFIIYGNEDSPVVPLMLYMPAKIGQVQWRKFPIHPLDPDLLGSWLFFLVSVPTACRILPYSTSAQEALFILVYTWKEAFERMTFRGVFWPMSKRERSKLQTVGKNWFCVALGIQIWD